MGEFQEVVKSIVALLNELADTGGVTSQKIPEIIGSTLEENRVIEGDARNAFNCYPGIPGHGCKDLAFFVSLTSPSFYKGRGHLNCGQAMEKIVQHMQGSCQGKTRHAIFLTDSWDAFAYNEWQANLSQIRQKALLEVYLFTGRSSSLISLPRY